MSTSKIPHFRVSYYDGRSDDVVLVGSWELALTERKFRERRDSYEATMYQVYLGAQRAGIVKRESKGGPDFDAWGVGVSFIESLTDAGEDASGESQAPSPES